MGHDGCDKVILEWIDRLCAEQAKSAALARRVKELEKALEPAKKALTSFSNREEETRGGVDRKVCCSQPYFAPHADDCEAMTALNALAALSESEQASREGEGNRG